MDTIHPFSKLLTLLRVNSGLDPSLVQYALDERRGRPTPWTGRLDSQE